MKSNPVLTQTFAQLKHFAKMATWITAVLLITVALKAYFQEAPQDGAPSARAFNSSASLQ